MSINHAFLIYTRCDHRCFVRSTGSRSSLSYMRQEKPSTQPHEYKIKISMKYY